MIKIATYGSLKQGFYNHKRFGLGKPIAKSKIKGEMYLSYSYPHLYREEVSKEDKVREHEVEIYEITEELYNIIERMEIASGYQRVSMKMEDHDVIIFFSEDELNYKPEDKFLESYTKETVPEAVIN